MEKEIIEKLDELNSVFTPSSPIEQKELFAGRIEYIAKSIAIIKQPGRHIAIYGDRGVGKTSFANLIRIIMFSPESMIAKSLLCL